MSSPEYTLRRATVDDLAGLKNLWERAHLQVLDLEKRLTEFQIAMNEAGDLAGAIGLQIDSKQGKLHSEAVAQPDNQDLLRQLFWERLQIVARNHGLVRLWTEEESPFWTRCGFQPADPELAGKRLPAVFGEATRRWQTLQLREESAAAISLEHEFDLFQAAQKDSSNRLMQQAAVLKTFAYVLLGIALVVCGYFVVRVIIGNPSILTGGRP